MFRYCSCHQRAYHAAKYFSMFILYANIFWYHENGIYFNNSKQKSSPDLSTCYRFHHLLISFYCIVLIAYCTLNSFSVGSVVWLCGMRNSYCVTYAMCFRIYLDPNQPTEIVIPYIQKYIIYERVKITSHRIFSSAQALFIQFLGTMSLMSFCVWKSYMSSYLPKYIRRISHTTLAMEFLNIQAKCQQASQFYKYFMLLVCLSNIHILNFVFIFCL